VRLLLEMTLHHELVHLADDEFQGLSKEEYLRLRNEIPYYQLSFEQKAYRAGWEYLLLNMTKEEALAIPSVRKWAYETGIVKESGV